MAECQGGIELEVNWLAIASLITEGEARYIGHFVANHPDQCIHCQGKERVRKCPVIVCLCCISGYPASCKNCGHCITNVSCESIFG